VTEFELGWLVAILEGEGSFGFDHSLRVQMRNCDLEVVGRFVNLTDAGVSEQKGYKANHSTSYVAYLCGARAKELMLLVAPYMSEKRRNQIRDALVKDIRRPRNAKEAFKA
jgi:hypothetical protein